MSASQSSPPVPGTNATGTGGRQPRVGFDGKPCRYCRGERTPTQGAHGWCRSCYCRWLRAGRPVEGPPPAKRRASPIITCSCCLRESVNHAAHGWCYRCYDRWIEAGRPDDGPPEATRSERELAARREDYAWLRTELGLSRAQAAERIGVSDNTADRYEAWMKEGS